ncbi:hypothetical protein LUZ60_006955 [Juncus effusus]|nr:hypothetical protein LUZ60_006955 [Juncus effusus]
MEEKRKTTVLVVGGTGYLGQHLLQSLILSSNSYDVAFTHHRPIPPEELLGALPAVRSFHVDVQTGRGLDEISSSFGQPDVIINCAAISIPRACETDPNKAMATNQPSTLVNWILGFQNPESENPGFGNTRFGNPGPLLIHLSTDQVYEGVKSYYKEDDETLPVNMYGKSKVAAEKLIIEKCVNYAILRSSIIYGPQSISPVSRSLPIQWIDGILSQGKEVDFFHDEFRCPIYVKDMVNVIIFLAKMWISDKKKMQIVLNVGGPDRLSRVEMAESVAKFRRYDQTLIKSVSASSVNRGVVSPSDISMDITRLVELIGSKPTSFQDGVKQTLTISK